MNVQEIKERLALTHEQLEQVSPVVSDELDRMRAVRDKYDCGDKSPRARSGWEESFERYNWRRTRF